MRVARLQLSRRELALVAVALLLPVPLLAVSGVSAPLPNAIERGLGSMVTLEIEDEGPETQAVDGTSRRGSPGTRSQRGSLRSGLRASLTSIQRKEEIPTRASGSAATSKRPAGDGGGTDAPAAGEPEGAGDSEADSPDSPHGPSAAPEWSPEHGSADGPGTAREPGAFLAVVAQGTTGEVSAGTDGIGIGTGADPGDAGGEKAGGVIVVVTNTNGSSTGATLARPGTGVSPP